MRFCSVFDLLSVIAALVAAVVPYAISGSARAGHAKLQVVAAENFYGDLATQLGGDHVQVTSIMDDPNVDPHEYEADPKDALAVGKANLVIQNGLDYDNWMPRLLAASPNSSRALITAAEISPNVLKENPHIWYSLEDIRDIADAITKTYENLDAADKEEFEKNLNAFDNSIGPIKKEMKSIATEFAGTPVGLTETIYLYQTAPMKLNVMTPWEFQHAISQGNDPPVTSIAAANTQVTAHQIKVLIYDVQAVTPITTHLQQEAREAGIPVVGVSETMPRDETYQSWMLKQLRALHTALQSGTK